MISWNIAGLLAKLSDSEIVNFLERADIVFLCETWMENGTNLNLLQNFRHFFLNAKRTSKFGRPSGGLFIGIKQSLFKTWNFDTKLYKQFITIKCQHKVNKSEACFFIGAYVSDIENCLADLFPVVENLTDVPVFYFGDFNARIGSENTISESDICPCECFVKNYGERKTRDKIVNGAGEKLLDFCDELNLIVLNGRTISDSVGDYTYISVRGNSVIDFLICNEKALKLVEQFKIVTRTESDHLPLEFSCRMASVKDLAINQVNRRFKWDKNSSEFVNKLSNLCDWEENLNVEQDNNLITEAFKQAASHLKNSNGPFQRKSGWFDKNCTVAKKKCMRSLKELRKVNNTENRKEYHENRRNYRGVCKKAKQHYLNTMQDEICKAKDSKIFWDCINRFKGKNYVAPSPSITSEQWIKHFQNLFSMGHKFVHYNLACDERSDAGELTKSFARVEIAQAICGLKNNKSPGTDDILNEFIIAAPDMMRSKLQILFNKILSEGKIPALWKEAIIIPIYKKGKDTNTENYRGISLLNSTYKLFTGCIQARLKNWLDSNKLIPEEQAGFRTGYSTMDNIFILETLIKKQLSKKRGKLYVFFVDFSCAFDMVNRDKLCEALGKLGVGQKFLALIRALLEGSTAKIRTANGYSDSFEINQGVRQGCKLSPLLFSTFINQLICALNEKDFGGAKIEEIIIKVLAFADDFALIARNVVEMQKMIKVLYSFAHSMGMKVNLSKSKIMVFKNGGKLSKYEKWYYGNEKIEVVRNYKYLGVWFSSNGRFLTHVQKAALTAKQTLGRIWNIFVDLRLSALNPKMKLFNSVIKSALLYGAEVWGVEQFKEVDRVLIWFIKKLFWLKTSTPNYMIYLEFGLLPLWIDCLKLHLGYCQKVSFYEEHRFPKKCMNHRFKNDMELFKSLKTTINSVGYGGDLDLEDIVELKNNIIFTIIENQLQYFFHQLDLSKRVYQEIKNDFLRETYLNSKLPFNLIRIIARTRCESTPCSIHQFVDDKICRFCNFEIQTLEHILYTCTFFSDDRQKFLELTNVHSANSHRNFINNLRGPLKHKGWLFRPLKIN